MGQLYNPVLSFSLSVQVIITRIVVGCSILLMILISGGATKATSASAAEPAAPKPQVAPVPPAAAPAAQPTAGAIPTTPPPRPTPPSSPVSSIPAASIEPRAAAPLNVSQTSQVRNNCYFLYQFSLLWTLFISRQFL